MKRRMSIAGATALLFGAAACGGGNGADVVAPPPTNAPPAQPTSFDVVPCFTQSVTPGRTVASLVVPDVLTIDLSRPAGFPNGRDLDDSVVDRTLAMIFLDLTVHSIDTFQQIPLNPPANDKPFRAAFPFVAMAWGGDRPMLGGSNFNFRTDPESAYVRVDREGMPALATALIGISFRNAFNNDSPADDLSTSPQGLFKWVPEFQTQLVALTNALGDDLKAAGLTLCAKPI